MLKTPDQPLKAGILVCPNYAIMDVIGTHTVFGLSPNTEVHLVWKDLRPFDAMPRFPTAATTTFEDCPEDLDVLMVGAIPPEVIEDNAVQAFFRRHHERGACLIGVCGGSLLLGAAGLLEGRRATTNFHVLDVLPLVGSEAQAGGQVIVDGRIYTAGPITGSFEAALMVLALMRGEDAARFVELNMEYAPNPPFGVGSPEKAGPDLTAQAIAAFAPLIEASRHAAARGYERTRSRPGPAHA